MENIMVKKRRRIEEILEQATDSSSSSSDEDYHSLEQKSFRIKRKRIANIFNNLNRACNYRPSIIERHFADKRFSSSTPRNNDKKTTAINISQNISSIDASQIANEANTSSSKFGDLNEESEREDNLLQKNKDIRENCMRAAERRLTQYFLKNKNSKIPIDRLTDVNRNKTSQKLQYNSSYKFKSPQQNSVNNIVANCSQIQENLYVNNQAKLEKSQKTIIKCEEKEINENNFVAELVESSSLSDIESFYEKRKKRKNSNIKVLQNITVLRCKDKCPNKDSSSEDEENLASRSRKTVKKKLHRSRSSIVGTKNFINSCGVFDSSSTSEDECRSKKLQKKLSEDVISPSYPEAQNNDLMKYKISDSHTPAASVKVKHDEKILTKSRKKKQHESSDLEVQTDRTLNNVITNKTNKKGKSKTPCKTDVTIFQPVVMFENISVRNTKKKQIHKSNENKTLPNNTINKSFNKRKSKTHRKESEKKENNAVANISMNKVTNKRMVKTKSEKNKTQIIPEDAADNTIDTHIEKIQHEMSVIENIAIPSTSKKYKSKNQNTSKVKKNSLTLVRESKNISEIILNESEAVQWKTDKVKIPKELRGLLLNSGSNRDDILQTLINSRSEENESTETSGLRRSQRSRKTIEKCVLRFIVDKSKPKQLKNKAHKRKKRNTFKKPFTPPPKIIVHEEQQNVSNDVSEQTEEKIFEDGTGISEGYGTASEINFPIKQQLFADNSVQSRNEHDADNLINSLSQQSDRIVSKNNNNSVTVTNCGKSQTYSCFESNYKDEKNSTNKLKTRFRLKNKEEGLSIGSMELNLGAEKRKIHSFKYHVGFIVTKGEAFVRIENNEKVVKTFEAFFVPKGVTYYIKNISKTDKLLLHFMLRK